MKEFSVLGQCEKASEGMNKKGGFVMKRLISLLIALGLLIGAASTAKAAPTDTFNITITVNFLDITLGDY